MRVMKLLCSVGLATYKVSMDKNMNQELYIILLTHEKKTPRMIAQLRTQFAIGKGTKIINYSMIFQ